MPALEILARRAVPIFRRAIQEFQPHRVLPMPSSWRRSFYRGFNQSCVLLRSLQKQTDLKTPSVDAVLRKHQKPQAHQSRKERLRRLEGCFHIKKRLDLAGQKIMVFDDVMTTGATAEAFSKELLRGGAGEVNVFVLARVGRAYS